MLPQSKIVESEDVEEIHLQEQFIRQVEDHSLPAQEVLTDQQVVRVPSEPTALFVP
jgi:hypothetical protein